MSGRGGFADYRGEASVRPNAGDPAPGAGDDIPPSREGLSDSQQRFLAGLSPASRDATLRRLAQVKYRDPRRVSQDELDDMDDDQKWAWLEQVCTAEGQAAQRAAHTQDQMEGHQC